MSRFDAILHLDSGEEAMFRLVLRNAANYLGALPDEKFQLDVVANGGGVSHFAQKNEELHQAVVDLQARGVRFKLCANAMRDHGLGKSDIWSGLEVVPAGLVEIVRLQREGFAYIKP